MNRLSAYLLGVMCGIIMGIFLCWEVVYPIWIESKQVVNDVKLLEKDVQILKLKQSSVISEEQVIKRKGVK